MEENWWNFGDNSVKFSEYIGEFWENLWKKIDEFQWKINLMKLWETFVEVLGKILMKFWEKYSPWARFGETLIKIW